MKYDTQIRRLEKFQKEIGHHKQLKEAAEKEKDRLYSILDGIMHEMRRLNTEISSACDDLSKQIKNNSLEKITEGIETIFYTSGLISSRLTFADFEINPQSISRQTKLSTVVYKKFDKARRLLSKAAREKSIEIKFEGNSYNEFNVLPAFELVPFVLLDNAIKYSAVKQEVVVSFQDNPNQNCRTIVTIKSVGPIVFASESENLVERGFRGKNAISSTLPGEGIGLFLANSLMKLAKGKLNINASEHPLFTFDGISYANFVVSLEFYT